ncbi:hypothetical protein V5O48_017188 [Marasmius crinis-equi]|uniref:Uncharacterized protein n=1 Tax=Marasmius crinis-equi TaxID=585013 RepID=A0ABR3EPP2_9AGAR
MNSSYKTNPKATEPIASPPTLPPRLPSVRSPRLQARSRSRTFPTPNDVFSTPAPESTATTPAPAPFVIKSSLSLDDPPRFLQSPVRARCRVTADIETLTMRTRRTRRSLRQRQRDRQALLTGMFPKPRDLRGEGEEKYGEEEAEGEGNITIEATTIQIDSPDGIDRDTSPGTGAGLTGLLSLLSWGKGRDTETASVPVHPILRTPTRTIRRRPFELSVPPATPRTPRRFGNGSEDGDQDIPPMPSTPVKGDLAIAVRRKAREEGRRRAEEAGRK